LVAVEADVEMEADKATAKSVKTASSIVTLSGDRYVLVEKIDDPKVKLILMLSQFY
jgi:catabolite regulation protein CreA